MVARFFLRTVVRDGYEDILTGYWITDLIITYAQVRQQGSHNGMLKIDAGCDPKSGRRIQSLTSGFRKNEKQKGVEPILVS
jgi:hypothetical protein